MPVAELGALLRAQGYTAPGLAAALGADAAPDELLSHSARFAMMYGAELLDHDRSVLASLTALFWLCAPVGRDRYAAMLPEPLRAGLQALGWIVPHGASTVRSAVAITPLDGLLFASDPLFRHRGGYALDFSADRASVMPVHASSLTLLRAAQDGRPVGRVCDVGCGSGCLAQVLGRDAATPAAGIDRSPRAVRYSRWSAELNREVARPPSFEVADAYHYVPAAPFDLVVFNAPWGPTYDRALQPALSGDATAPVRALIAERLSLLLAPGGRCQIFGIFYKNDDRALAAALTPPGAELAVMAEELPGSGFGWAAEDLAAGRLRPGSQLIRGPEDVDVLRRFLADRGVHAVAATLVTVTRAPINDAPRVQRS